MTIPTPIIVHHLENSRSQRVLWMLEELGLPYEVKRYERNKQTMLAPPELKKVHPLGKSPVIEDGGLILIETGAIIEYLVEKYGNGQLLPPDAERGAYLEWLHFTEGTLGMPMLMRLLAPRLGLPATAIGFMDAELTKQLDWIEGQLANRQFLCGDTFTGADINLEYMLEHAEQMGLLSTRPNLNGYLQRLKARPAYKQAIELGGPVTLAR